MSTEGREYLFQLRYLLEQHCLPEEIKGLCDELNVDYYSLPNRSWPLKLNGLIRRCAKQGRLEKMTGKLKMLKPDVRWPAVPPAGQQIQDQDFVTSQDEGGEATLQRFLDELQGLLRAEKRDYPEANQRPASYLSRSVAETLLHLDPKRKAELVRLLYRANLISGQSPIVNLGGADLSQVDLGWQNLPEINLSNANLSGADLSLCNLRGAHLAGANLRQAAAKALLADADLTGADLREAQLSGAKLIGAALNGVNLRVAELRGADLSGADLKGADLTLANLSEANLSGADLSLARLDNANLTGSDLRNATLNRANMSGTTVDQKQLEQAISMEGAIVIPRKRQAFG